MVLKRFSNELDNDDEPKSSKRPLSLTCSDLILARDVTLEDLRSLFEPVFRKTVREVVDKFLHVSSPLQRSISNVSHDETRRDWMLRFVNQPPSRLFTGNKVEDKDGALLRVEIVDVGSGTVVLAAPMSSLKLEIVVLRGDFDADQRQDLGEKYFSSQVVCAREGKKPLITGEVRTSLKNGVGFIKNVCFNDNSRWTKSAKFRLGVRVLQNSCKGFRIREAASDAFEVKDRRGEACKKHSCPSLTDEVWRLKMIGRNGKFHQRLTSIGIQTVGDFLQRLEENPSALKETLKRGSSNRTWNTIVEHALSHDKEQYEAQKVSPKAVCFINHNFKFQQVADDLVGYASNSGINRVPVDVAPNYSSVDLQPELLTHLSPPLPYVDIPDIYPDHHVHEFMASSSYYYGMNNRVEDALPNPALSGLHQVDDIVASLSTGMSDEEFRLWFMGESSDMLIQPTDHHNLGDPIIQTEPISWRPSPQFLWRQPSASFSTAISESDMGPFSYLVPNNTTPRTAWCKLRAAVIWRILIGQMRVMRAKKAISNHVL